MTTLSMKILAFGDVHGDDEALSAIHKLAIARNPDILVCVGDFTIFGMDMLVLLEQLNLLAEIIQKPLFLIPGNHEDEDELAEIISEYENITYIHRKAHIHDNVLFIGYGGGGFAQRDPDFANFIQELGPVQLPCVLLTHQPPFGNNLDTLHGKSTGNSDYTNFIRETQPLLALSGHIHENFGVQDKIGNTILLNPGPKGIIISIDVTDTGE